MPFPNPPNLHPIPNPPTLSAILLLPGLHTDEPESKHTHLGTTLITAWHP